MISPVGNKAGLVGALEKQDKRIKNQEVNATQKREDKVAVIKQAIKNGTYKIDLQITSEKMALNLLNL
ncbi:MULTISPECIES: flagellar biosynthesis anti-sigma factor FlgM [unclassified Helicobacter]|uniref:flagellar biosynthesis anti-sigma factor FlgM n=1 Tax=unclassified Helicobacter TaxID=2593540 RepID=UPI000CF05FE2|nr:MULTISPECIES: flagellar biosynthesis anti-sigma factor FlgM [unclassified Helicobacter]